MAAALQLLIDGPRLLYVAGFAIVTVLLEVFVRYARYVSVLQVADAVALRLCGGRVRGRRALGRPWPSTWWCRMSPRRRLSHRRRRHLRHHDQPLSLLLAGRGGGRGSERRSDGQAARSRARAGAGPDGRASQIDTSSAWASPTSSPSSSCSPRRRRCTPTASPTSRPRPRRPRRCARSPAASPS